jgi:hypothetical protein
VSLQVNSKSFLKLSLKPGFTGFNVVTYYILIFTVGVILQFITVQLTFILKAKDYYNLDEKDVARVSGECGFIAQIFVITLDLLLGLIFDTVGRKIPLVLGLLSSGLSILLMP